MSRRIRISPNQVRGVASKFRSSSRESERIIKSLQSEVSSMSSEWEGMAKERFFNDFQEWQHSMDHFVNMLDDIGVELRRIADTLEERDRQLANS